MTMWSLSCMSHTYDEPFQVIVRSTGAITKFQNTHLNDIDLSKTESSVSENDDTNSIYLFWWIVLIVVRCPEFRRHLHHHIVEIAFHRDIVHVPFGNVIARMIPILMRRNLGEFLPEDTHMCLRCRVRSVTMDLQSEAFSHASMREWFRFHLHRCLTRLPTTFDRIELVAYDDLLGVLLDLEVQPEEETRPLSDTSMIGSSYHGSLSCTTFFTASLHRMRLVVRGRRCV